MPCEGVANFMAIGDQGTGDHNQIAVANGLAIAAGQTNELVGILGMGDNFYGDGITDADDPQVKSKFRDIYFNHATLNKVWYMVLGNHDYYGNAAAQIQINDSNWYMPDRWYKKTHTANGLTIDMFHIDSCVWAWSYMCDMQDWKVSPNKVDEQKRWFKSAIENQTNADWKVVIGHFPFWSVGDHGHRAETAGFDDLKQMMEANGVNLFLSGHDHSVQIIQHDGMMQVVSGAGGKQPRTKKLSQLPSRESLKQMSRLGFVGVHFCNASQVDVLVYDKDGTMKTYHSHMNGAAIMSEGSSLAAKAVMPAVEVLESAQPVCGSTALKGVDLRCERNAGCMALPAVISATPCNEFCAKSGLACKNGFWTTSEDCSHDLTNITCNHTNKVEGTFNMVCECEPYFSVL
jgi:predicted phosphodiesterase